MRSGSTGQTYPQLVQAQPPTDAAETVVFGSRNDVAAAPSRCKHRSARRSRPSGPADPTTQLVVIGACWSRANTPAELTAVSSAVRAAAQAAGATYIDPLTQGWFADPASPVSPADGISLLNAGHSYPAGLIASLVDIARSS